MPFSCVLKYWPRHTHLKLIYLSLPICLIIWVLKWRNDKTNLPTNIINLQLSMCVLILLKSMIKVTYWCLVSNILWFHVLLYIPMLYVFFKHPRLSVFYAFHQRTCFNFTNRIWYNFKINGVCLLYNSGFKLSMKVERTFFSWFFYILCPFF